MNNVEALKEIYVSLGGALSDTYETIADGIPVSDYAITPDVLAAISAKTSGAIELPTVTTTDAGKVLTVSDSGAWSAATPEAGLPEVTSADAGKVLTVDSEGAWAAETQASNDFIISALGRPENANANITFKKTQTEIYNDIKAAGSSKNIIIKAANADIDYIFRMVIDGTAAASASYTFIFMNKWGTHILEIPYNGGSSKVIETTFKPFAATN